MRSDFYAPSLMTLTTRTKSLNTYQNVIFYKKRPTLISGATVAAEILNEETEVSRINGLLA